MSFVGSKFSRSVIDSLDVIFKINVKKKKKKKGYGCLSVKQCGKYKLKVFKLLLYHSVVIVFQAHTLGLFKPLHHLKQGTNKLCLFRL